MADFHQNGIVTTLHNLKQRTLEEVEYELEAFSSTQTCAGTAFSFLRARGRGSAQYCARIKQSEISQRDCDRP